MPGRSVRVCAAAAPVVSSVATANAVFNRTKVQTDVANAIEQQTGTGVTVTCPQNPPLNPGSQFQCIATAADGSRVFVTITIQDSRGDYTWRVG